LCRLLVVLGSRRGVDRIRATLIDSLVKAARNDPYGGALFGSDEISHRDGWGFVRILMGREGVYAELLGRSLSPIFEDPGIDIPKGSEGFSSAEILMLHARAASKGMPINIFSTHPTEALTPQGYRLYMIHNGAVDKSSVLRELGVELDAPYARRYNDTHFLTQLIASKVKEGIDRSLIYGAAKHVKTALNIGITLVKDREAQVAVGSLYKLGGEHEDLRKKKDNYYKLYEGFDGDLRIYASSTLIDHYRPEENIEWKILENGCFKIYEVRDVVRLMDSFCL
jgi:predicted glutamine amidotransferase